MQVIDFLKNHKKEVVRVSFAFLLSAVAAVFVYAFGKGALPYSEDGDAFDTIYAIEENPEENLESEENPE